MKKNLSVIIPTAGKGIRLKPFTDTIPKSLIEIAGKPILKHILDKVVKLKPSKIYIVTGHLGSEVKKFVRKSYPELNVSFVTQKTPKGLGNAVMLAIKKIKTPVFIILGDTIISENYKKLIYPQKNCIAVKKVAHPRKYGIVKIKNGYIADIAEKPSKPKSNLAIVGAYYFHETNKLRKELIKINKSKTKTHGEIQLTDAIKKMLETGSKVKSVKIKKWYDCGTFKNIIHANRYLLKEIKKNEKNNIPGCAIKHPTLLYPCAEITNSHIGPYVSIGKKAKIKNCKIKNAIICKNTRLRNEILCNIIVHKKHRKCL